VQVNSTSGTAGRTHLDQANRHRVWIIRPSEPGLNHVLAVEGGGIGPGGAGDARPACSRSRCPLMKLAFVVSLRSLATLGPAQEPKPAPADPPRAAPRMVTDATRGDAAGT
jgi:hypothetical protein